MKRIEDLIWETFTKSGETGYYMLYNALNDSNRDKQK